MHYSNPAVAVDLVIISMVDTLPCVALDRRKNDPFKGELSLPGVLMGEMETIPQAANRAANKVGIESINNKINPLSYRDNPARDERFRVLSLPHIVASAPWGRSWTPLNNVLKMKEMPFDHNSILKEAGEFILRSINDSPVFLAELMGNEVTSTKVKSLFHSINPDLCTSSLTRELKRSFELSGKKSNGRGRPENIYFLPELNKGSDSK